jgi:mannose-6-phosphate isomerase-like protein (cupin superfamily)
VRFNVRRGGLFPWKSDAPEHVHADQTEILYVLEGRGYMHFDGERKEISPGIFMFVPKGVVHSIEAVSGEDLKVLYVFSPPVK